VEALSKDFLEHGAKAIETCRETKPEVYLMVICKVMPKELNVKTDGPEAFVRIWNAISSGLPANPDRDDRISCRSRLRLGEPGGPLMSPYKMEWRAEDRPAREPQCRCTRPRTPAHADRNGRAAPLLEEPWPAARTARPIYRRW